MFVLGKPFQPSLIFVGEARSLPKSGAPEKSFIVQATGFYLDLCLNILKNVRFIIFFSSWHFCMLTRVKCSTVSMLKAYWTCFSKGTSLVDILKSKQDINDSD